MVVLLMFVLISLFFIQLVGDIVLYLIYLKCFSKALNKKKKESTLRKTKQEYCCIYGPKLCLA